MTRKKAIETLKENLCAMCAYGSQNMESCDIRSCDKRDAIKALEQEPTTKNGISNRTIIYKAKESKEIQKDLDKLSEINKTTTKDDCESCIHNKGVLECDMYGCKYEPTTKNDLGVDAAVVPFLDAISRQEAIDTIRQLYLDLASQKAVIDILKVLPSVTPQEPKVGHWLTHKEYCDKNNLLPSGYGSYFWCSECDCGIDSKNFSRVNYNYCPNCGRKME